MSAPLPPIARTDSADAPARCRGAAAPSPLHLACLCAAWCRLCDDYAPILSAVAQAFAADGVPLQTHWIDIEDEADLVGDLDVVMFPMIVIAAGTQARFAGPVTPQADTLRRLLRAALDDVRTGVPAIEVSAEVQAFAVRLDRRAS